MENIGSTDLLTYEYNNYGLIPKQIWQAYIDDLASE